MPFSEGVYKPLLLQMSGQAVGAFVWVTKSGYQDLYNKLVIEEVGKLANEHAGIY